MPDISHTFGSDLTLGPTGDLAVSDGAQLGQERVLRRLLTNPQGYVWHPTYGAGLARFLGMPMAPQRMGAITRAQMFQEAAVAQDPAPQVTVAAQKDGTVVESIAYVDADTGATTTLTFPVS
jgi:hypothetical protein